MPDTLPDVVTETPIVTEPTPEVNQPDPALAEQLDMLPELPSVAEGADDIATPPQPSPDAPRRRGRPKGSLNGNKKPSAEKLAESAPALDESIAISAIATVDSITNIMASLIGPEWVTEKQERENLVSVTANYYKSKGLTDIPPGALLAIVWGGYCAARFQHENTRSKLFGFFRTAYGSIRGLIAKYVW